MIKKINFLDKNVRKKHLEIMGVIGTIFSLLLMFIDIPKELKGVKGLTIFMLFLLCIYVFLWVRANGLKKTKINIAGTSIIIKKGDIFEEKDLKTIPFNEFFDTIVDDKIIAKKSLNGKYIQRIYKDVEKLNNIIKNDPDLNVEKNIVDKNIIRKNNKGNTKKYKLGSVVVVDDYILTAFSHFNENNEANISIGEYINFLLNFWNEVNRVYAQKSVTVPLFGGGITRFSGKYSSVEEYELLLIMIWTFRLSETRFKYPAKLTIVIYEEIFDKIDLFNLKEEIQQ